MRALILLMLGMGCAGHTQTELSLSRPDTRVKVVAVSQPVFVQDLEPAYVEAPLWSGYFVGNVVFSGGFEVVERSGGLENVSVNQETSLEERYRGQIGDVVSDCVAEGLGREGRDWVPVSLERAPPLPSRRDVRGTIKQDGRDNQPLPRFSLTPSTWEGGAPVPSGADALLVPFVVHYYAHNGGWFIGQTYGSAGGARVRVLWALYGADGRVIGWGDHGARTEEHGHFSPNSQEIQDYLMDVEEAVCRSVRRKLP